MAKKAAGIKVKVTAQHIKDGIVGEADSCAIALAVQDAVEHHYQSCPDPLNIIDAGDLTVSVDSDNVTVNDFSMQSTPFIAKFVDAFDDQDKAPSRDDYANNEEYQIDLKNWKKKQAILKPFEFNLKF